MKDGSFMRPQENPMNRYIQSCEVLVLSKKHWRWIIVLLLALGDAILNLNQITIAYGKISYCESLIYHMQNETFAMVTSIIFLAVLFGDISRQGYWDLYYILRTGSRRHLSASLITLIVIYCMFLSAICVITHFAVAVLSGASLLPVLHRLSSNMAFLAQSGLHPLRACILAITLFFLRCCFLAQLVLFGNLMLKKLPLGLLILVFVGLVLDYQLYDIIGTNPLYILPYDNILLFPRGTGERPGYLFSFLYFMLINCGMSTAIYIKIKRNDFSIGGGL